MMSVMEQVEDSLLRLTGALKHPIVAIDPGPRKCGVASLMTDVETAGVVENQPPAGVTGKGGRTTRTLSLAFIYLV